MILMYSFVSFLSAVKNINIIFLDFDIRRCLIPAFCLVKKYIVSAFEPCLYQ